MKYYRLLENIGNNFKVLCIFAMPNLNRKQDNCMLEEKIIEYSNNGRCRIHWETFGRVSFEK